MVLIGTIRETNCCHMDVILPTFKWRSVDTEARYGLFCSGIHILSKHLFGCEFKAKSWPILMLEQMFGMLSQCTNETLMNIGD